MSPSGFADFLRKLGVDTDLHVAMDGWVLRATSKDKGTVLVKCGEGELWVMSQAKILKWLLEE